VRHVTLNKPVALSRDMASNFWGRLRELQWLLPLSVQKRLLRTVAVQYNPYSEWNYRDASIFIHVPRSAGTSIAFAIGAPKPHIPVSRYAAFDASLYNQFFKFAFVRNPWDRLLSSYSHICAAENDPEWKTHTAVLSRFKDFESFVLALEDPKLRRRILGFTHFRPQVDWLTLPRSKQIAVDFVGRFENLDLDYVIVADRLGISSPLPNVNASKHVPYRDAYSRRMRDIVAEMYSDDVNLLGYRF
jgi:hypothetical protein